MARRPQDVTDAELDVLRGLWDDGPATIRTLADRLYPGGSTSEYATVQKLLERLEDKGHVTHHSEGRQNVFSARVQREDLVARRLREHRRAALRRLAHAAAHPPRQRGAALARRAAWSSAGSWTACPGGTEPWPILSASCSRTPRPLASSRSSPGLPPARSAARPWSTACGFSRSRGSSCRPSPRCPWCRRGAGLTIASSPLSPTVVAIPRASGDRSPAVEGGATAPPLPRRSPVAEPPASRWLPPRPPAWSLRPRRPDRRWAGNPPRGWQSRPGPSRSPS